MKVTNISITDSTSQPPRLTSFMEQWSLPLLMLALVTLSGAVISSGWGGENSWRFALVAFLAATVAVLCVHGRVSDFIGLLVAAVTGGAVIWILTAEFSGILEGNVWQRIQRLPNPVLDALVRDDMGGINRDLAVETLLSLTIWISSFVSMWMLLRVGFGFLALMPPSVLILANEHFADEDRSWPLILMVALGILIIIRSRFRGQRTTWRRQKIQVTDSIFGKVLISGLAIAVLVSSTLLMSPQAWSESVLQPVITGSIDRIEKVRLEAEYWFDDVLGTNSAPARMGSYTDFSDGFEVGGPLSLTDQPEVLANIDSESAPYLKARSYDHYTGRGWTSTAAGDFADEGDSVRQSPELLYNPNWEVALSQEARNERVSSSATITMLDPGSDSVLSVDSFLTANVQTVVRMSWTNVRDMPLVLTPANLNRLPPDVQLLGSLLLQSQLTGNQTSWGPEAISDTLQDAIEMEVDDLARRGIEVRWVATSDGLVETLYVTGRLPVFDDVEAVFRRETEPAASASYSVTGLTSLATSDQLIAAEDEYPTWASDRYLQVGDTFTDRTLELTQDIVGDETNPYLQAKLIEEWLRTNIVYDEGVHAPPGQQDLVDYVLFDNRRGYCEHYSAAMTVMLRSLGIPARAVVGYYPGEPDSAAGSYLYRQRNAHAWVEAYFPGYGWIPFEPTANRPLGEFDIEMTSGIDASPAIGEEKSATPEPAMPTADVATPDVDEDNSAATPQPTSADENNAPPSVLPNNQTGPPRWLLPMGVSSLVSAITLTGVWLFWQRGLRGLPPSAALMKRVQRIGDWLGIRSLSTTTPREYARKFDASAGALSGPVKRITRAYEIETFGPRQARDQILADARNAWREIRRKTLYVLRHKRRK